MKKTVKFFLWTMFFIAVLSILITQGTMKRKLRVKMEEQSAIYAGIMEKNEKLTNILSAAETDEYVYQQARSRLLMVKENEIAIIDSNVDDLKSKDAGN